MIENHKIDIDFLPLCIVIYEVDEDGDFVFKEINKKVEEVEKIDKHELLGKKVQKAFPGIRAMGLLELFEDVYNTGEEKTLEIGLYEDSFRYGWRRNIISKYSKTSILVIYEDIGLENDLIKDFEQTLQNKTEELKKQKMAFEELFEKSSDGIFIIEDNKFVQCNQKIVEMLQYSKKEDLLDSHPAQLSPQFQPDGQESFSKAEEMMALAIQKNEHSFEWLHKKSTGEKFWVDVNLSSILLLDKNVLYATVKDISERKDMEEKLQTYTTLLEATNRELEELTESLEEKVMEEISKNESQQKQLFAQSRLAQMGEMISMIAHQWRQPLGAISATSSNLKFKLEFDTFDMSSKQGGEKLKQYFLDKIDDIEAFVQSLTNTIDDFRNFYKPNKKTTQVNSKLVFEKALTIVQASFTSDGIEIIKECNSSMTIELYENEMMQVILNILKNAQDNFREKKIQNPKIYLRTEDIKGKLMINICDNGGGIPTNILDEIFDPYFSTKHEKNGTGLGLYMSKVIVQEHHKGFLSVDNKDNGACFKIEIGGGD